MLSSIGATRLLGGGDGLWPSLDPLRDGLFIVSDRYGIEYANPVMEREFGTCSGSRCFEWLCGRSEPCPRCAAGRFSGRETVPYEWYSRKTGKTYRLLDIPLHAGEGTFKLVILRDEAIQKQSDDTATPCHRDNRSQKECFDRLLFIEDLEGELPDMLEMLRDVLGAGRACLLKNYIDPEKGVSFRMTHAAEREPMDPRMEAYLLTGVPYTKTSPFWQGVASGKAVISGPFTILTDDGTCFPVESIRIIPLLVGENWYGCLSFSHASPGHEWTGDDVNFMRAAARMIAIHLNRESINRNLVQKHTALKFASEYKRTISRVAKYLISDDSIVNDLQKVLQLCMQELQINRIDIYSDDTAPGIADLFGSGASHAAVVPGFPPLSQAPWASVPRIAEFLRTNHWYISHDLSDLEEADAARLNRENVYAVHISALNVSGTPSGWIAFTQDRRHFWNRRETVALSTITNMIANAWERYINLNLRFNAERKQEEAVHIAEEASRAVSFAALSSGIAHEINRPLSALKMIVDGMRYWRMHQYTHSEEEIFRNVELISEQADKINDIVVNMRALSRRDDTDTCVLFSINDIIRRVLTFVEDRLSAAAIRVDSRLDDELPLFHGHPIYIEQVVSNLVVNAIQAMDHFSDGERVLSIHTGFADSVYTLRISDTGPGIREEMLPRLFQPFVSSKTMEDGMGLGLFVVRTVLSTMGGSITASNGNPGAVFSIVIPARRRGDIS